MPAPRGLVQQIDQELHRTGVIPRGARLLLAVSGGADSVALLRLMLAINQSDYWNWTLVVGHVEHGIRGEESSEDAKWVAATAKALGLPYAERSLKLGANTPEAKARSERHFALEEMVSEHDCAGVVMAHHADDQAETVLMRIFRGCGIDGLGAMTDRVDLGDDAETVSKFPKGHKDVWHLTIWRPLLQVRRTELRQYLAELGQSWREDATNTSAKYARNRVRSEIIPLVEGLWPGAVNALGRLSRIAWDSHMVVNEASVEFMEKHLMAGEYLAFPRKVLQAALPGLVAEVLRSTAVIKFGIDLDDFERITEAVRLIQGTHGKKEIELGSEIVVEIEGKLVRMVGRTKPRDE